MADQDAVRLRPVVMERKKIREGSSMNVLRKYHLPALAVLAGSALLAVAVAYGDAAQLPAPTLAAPTTPDKKPDADGFIQRWLLLEPIPANGLTDAIVQATVKKEYFPNQFTIVPHDGDKVTVSDGQLTWHAVDTKLYNVNLYHFAYALGKRTSDALFWAVTVVNAPQEMRGVR